MASSSFTPLRKASSHSNLMTDREISRAADVGAGVRSSSSEDTKESKSDTDIDDEEEDENKKRGIT